jgi:hypothetical protein
MLDFMATIFESILVQVTCRLSSDQGLLENGADHQQLRRFRQSPRVMISTVDFVARPTGLAPCAARRCDRLATWGVALAFEAPIDGRACGYAMPAASPC